LSATVGKIEQRVCIKFCVKLGKSATETLEMLHGAFGEHSIYWTAFFEWHSRLKAGRISVEDERSGRSSTRKTTENVKKSNTDPRRPSPNNPELADTAGISYGVCQEIVTENLNMRRIAAKFVPRLLTNDQKQRRVNVCLELREKANEDPNLFPGSYCVTKVEFTVMIQK
jgi:hypothetical protein